MAENNVLRTRKFLFGSVVHAQNSMKSYVIVCHYKSVSFLRFQLREVALAVVEIMNSYDEQHFAH